ncbi:hypothetical protein CUT18_09925, partial [Campylobacter jejuni]|nr:hypothetical protein [Campylobacter jejuni]
FYMLFILFLYVFLNSFCTKPKHFPPFFYLTISCHSSKLLNFSFNSFKSITVSSLFNSSNNSLIFSSGSVLLLFLIRYKNSFCSFSLSAS